MLPFALKSLDRIEQQIASTSTATSCSRIEAIGLRFLSCSSKERDGAVILLARYHSRQDSESLPFFAHCHSILEMVETNVYLVSQYNSITESLLNR